MPVVTRPAAAAAVELPDVGYSISTWYPPVGPPLPLHAPLGGLITLADGVSGLDAAAIEITTDDQDRGGVKVRHIQPQPRIITWPLYVHGATHQEFIERWRATGRAFTMTTQYGPGQLEIARPDGTARLVEAYYQAGFSASGKQGYNITSDFFALTLMCEKPYWRAAEPILVHREAGTGVDYLAPYPSVSSSQVLGETTVYNPGDVGAWPDWLVTGPASLLTATLDTTGQLFTLDPDAPDVAHGNLVTGEQVVINTDPPRVRFGDENWMGALGWPESELWGLPAGESAVTFQLDGSGAGSAVDLSYYPLYESA